MADYKIQNDPITGNPSSVFFAANNWSIPLIETNSNCRDFLIAWRDGASVEDANGDPITHNEAAVEALGLTPPE